MNTPGCSQKFFCQACESGPGAGVGNRWRDGAGESFTEERGMDLRIGRSGHCRRDARGGRSEKIYDQLVCADLTDTFQLSKSYYGGMISASTFTHGHLGPEVLFDLFSLAQSVAHAVIGINAQHYGNQDFAGAFRDSG